MFDACLRHLCKFYYGGELYDAEAVEKGYQKLHLGAAMFCIINMYNTMINGVGIDDRSELLFKKEKE